MTLLKSEASEKLQAVKLDPTKEMLNLHEDMASNADDEDVTKLRKKFIEKLANE